MTINTYIYIFIAMLFCHVFDDYVLQGCLANLKQKKWWESNPNYNDKYKNDYVVALICHSVSWSFIIMLPIAIAAHFNMSWFVLVMFPINVFVHFVTDNAKANQLKINLVQDQTNHLFQIILTYATFIFSEVF